MSFLFKIGRLARTPQGKKALSKAQAYAASPEGKKRIEQVRERVERVSGPKKPR